MCWSAPSKSPCPLGGQERDLILKGLLPRLWSWVLYDWRLAWADSLRFSLVPAKMLQPRCWKGLHPRFQSAHTNMDKYQGQPSGTCVPPPHTPLLWTHLRFPTWKRRSVSWAGQCCSHCRFSAAWWWPGWLCCGWSLSRGSPGLGYRQSQRMGVSWPPGEEGEKWKATEYMQKAQLAKKHKPCQGQGKSWNKDHQGAVQLASRFDLHFYKELLHPRKLRRARNNTRPVTHSLRLVNRVVFFPSVKCSLRLYSTHKLWQVRLYPRVEVIYTKSSPNLTSFLF